MCYALFLLEERAPAHQRFYRFCITQLELLPPCEKAMISYVFVHSLYIVYIHRLYCLVLFLGGQSRGWQVLFNDTFQLETDGRRSLLDTPSEKFDADFRQLMTIAHWRFEDPVWNYILVDKTYLDHTCWMCQQLEVCGGHCVASNAQECILLAASCPSDLGG